MYLGSFLKTGLLGVSSYIPGLLFSRLLSCTIAPKFVSLFCYFFHAFQNHHLPNFSTLFFSNTLIPSRYFEIFCFFLSSRSCFVKFRSLFSVGFLQACPCYIAYSIVRQGAYVLTLPFFCVPGFLSSAHPRIRNDW